MPQHIIGLVGTNASGKSAVSEYLKTSYGATVLVFSDYLAEAMNAIHLEYSKKNLIRMSETLRWGFGEDVLSRAIMKDALATNTDIVVLDGVRRKQELSELQSNEKFILLAVDADINIRFERMKSRVGGKSDDAETTWDAFMKKEQASTELTIPDVIKQATYTIQNNGTQVELEVKLDEVMAGVGLQKRG